MSVILGHSGVHHVAHYPEPPYLSQKQPMPGSTGQMNPRPDHGEDSYKGSGKLSGKKALITGGDSGIGRAVAIAFAREGADVLIAYLNENDDAQEVKALIEKEGCSGLLRSPAMSTALREWRRRRRSGMMLIHRGAIASRLSVHLAHVCPVFRVAGARLV